MIGPISLFVLIPLGLALLWSVRLLYRSRGSVDDPIRLILNLAGWILVIVGIVGTVTHLLVAISPIGWVIVLAVVISVVSKYRALERRSLLWGLAVAASKGIPLEQAARAYAEERVDEMGIRAEKLAQALESGMPLPEALTVSRTWLPTDALVAVRVGCETGKLAPALAHVVRVDDELDLLVRSVFEKLVYLGLIVNVLIGILTFLMLKIVPVFNQMFMEFDLELPQMTQAVIALSDVSVAFWFIGLPLFFGFLFFFFAGVLYYVGWLPRDVPLLNRFGLRFDAAVVMRTLALAVRQNLPLDHIIAVLSNAYPKGSVRTRLAYAARRITDGEDWCGSLHRVGLIRQAEVAVLKAAERVGNLEWALEEMADSSVRRVAYRLRVWINILFPVVLLLFGMIVAFHVIGLFMPLVSLIQGLS